MKQLWLTSLDTYIKVYYIEVILYKRYYIKVGSQVTTHNRTLRNWEILVEPQKF